MFAFQGNNVAKSCCQHQATGLIKEWQGDSHGSMFYISLLPNRQTSNHHYHSFCPHGHTRRTHGYQENLFTGTAALLQFWISNAKCSSKLDCHILSFIFTTVYFLKGLKRQRSDSVRENYITSVISELHCLVLLKHKNVFRAKWNVIFN